jgi:hypothetical protein
VKWGKQVVAAWNGSHPSGQVSAEEIPAGKSSEEVIGASITAGNTPCLVFNTAPAAVPQFQKQGGLVALDSFSDGASYIQQRTGPRADQYKSPDGRFYQMPWKTNPVMIFYNKQAFQKAGINTANPPLKTYSEFLQTAKTVVAKGGVKAAIWPAPSSEFFQPWFDFYPLFIAQTGKQLVADGQPQFNNPDGVAVGSFWKQLYDQKLAPRELYNGDAFGDQKAAMAIVGPLLFPEPVRAPDGRPAYAMLHRPTWDLSWVSPDAGEPLPAGVHDPRPGIWVSFAPVEEVARDPRALAHFTQHRPVFAFQNLASDEHLPPDHWFWNPETSGGIFVEHGVRFFDAAAWLLGSRACEVQALEVARGEHGAVDTAIAATLHPGGATATYTHIFTHPEQNRPSISRPCWTGVSRTRSSPAGSRSSSTWRPGPTQPVPRFSATSGTEPTSCSRYQASGGRARNGSRSRPSASTADPSSGTAALRRAPSATTSAYTPPSGTRPPKSTSTARASAPASPTWPPRCARTASRSSPRMKHGKALPPRSPPARPPSPDSECHRPPFLAQASSTAARAPPEPGQAHEPAEPAPGRPSSQPQG